MAELKKKAFSQWEDRSQRGRASKMLVGSKQ